MTTIATRTSRKLSPAAAPESRPAHAGLHAGGAAQRQILQDARRRDLEAERLIGRDQSALLVHDLGRPADDTRYPTLAAAQRNLVFPVAAKHLLQQYLNLFALTRRAEIHTRAAQLGMLGADDAGQTPQRSV